MKRLRLPHGETRQERMYSMPDPDEGLAAYEACYRARWYGGPAPTQAQLDEVLALAEGYLDLTTYVLGQECCVGKLRDIWRARRRRVREHEEKANG